MSGTRVLVVDAEPGALEGCRGTLQDLPETEIVLELQGQRARERIASGGINLLVLGACLPSYEREELVRLAGQADRKLPVLILAGGPGRVGADKGTTPGQAERTQAPTHSRSLELVVHRLLEMEKGSREHGAGKPLPEVCLGLGEMVGRSGIMQEFFRRLRKVAANDLDVLITGETGTGKELVSRSIHQFSRRQSHPIRVVNCGAITESLMESELFGHERGAFTGAHGKQIGLVESANHGVFFLDEICELPSHLQSKLLRVLQERVIRPVGAVREIPVDVRFLAASSVDLAERVKAGRFSEALFYRIRQMHLEVPPLRDRPEDIVLLAAHFAEEYARESGKPRVTVAPEAIDALVDYSWPGNVRQLQNVIRSVVAMADGEVVRLQDVRAEIPELGVGATGPTGTGYLAARARNRAAYEVDRLRKLLRAHKGDVAEVAREAQLARWSIYRLLKKYGLNLAEFRARPDLACAASIR